MHPITWLKARTDRNLRRLRRSGDMRHWVWRQRRMQWHRRFSSWAVRAFDRRGQLRQDTRILATLARTAGIAIALTVLGVVGLEAACSALAPHLHWSGFFETVDLAHYETFVGVAIGAQATFLALFFTTVGVIASTSYARVPGDIRLLFVRERRSLLYVWNVVAALVVGIVLFVMPVLLHHRPHGLTLALLALLSAFSVLSLVILGTRLFYFFEPSTLSLPLPGRFARAVQSASASVKAPSELQQQAAHARADQVLHLYQELVTLTVKRELREARSPAGLITQLLGCWTRYARLKPSIPTNSPWFEQIASHPNWLTLDHSQLNLALDTGAGIQPTFAPDPLWIERRLAQRIEELLPVFSNTEDWSIAIQVADRAHDLVADLAARLQLEEAKLLRRVIGRFLLGVSTAETSGDAGESPTAAAWTSWKTFRLAAAERHVMGFTSYWLGFVRPREGLDPTIFGTYVDNSVESIAHTYRAGAPREVLNLFEDFATGIEFERRTEGQRVTPNWWVRHLVARLYSRIFLESTNEFLQEVATELVAPLIATESADAESTTVAIFDALELTNKLQYHMPIIRKALDALQLLRHQPTADEKWPDGTLSEDVIAQTDELLYAKLGDVALNLSHEQHKRDRPDLFGQAYKRLFDATFHAVIHGQNELARKLFPITIALADRAHARLQVDLASEFTRQQIIYGTEPLLDMMELSGYALLMQEVNDDGIWPDVVAMWNRIFSGNQAPQLGAQFLAVLSYHEDVFALTPGGVGRTNRQMELGRLLAARGIVTRFDGWKESPPVSRSAIVNALAPDNMIGINHNLADLFVAEYLLGRPDMSDLTVSRGVRTLSEELALERERLRDSDLEANDEHGDGQAEDEDEDGDT